MAQNVLSKARQLLTGKDTSFDWLNVPAKRPLTKLTERDLLRLESAIGAQLFGSLPDGRHRDFFCLDATTWIWHEEWLGNDQRMQSSTVRYEVQDRGILKIQESSRYSYLEGKELDNLLTATQMYYERVTREIYNRDPKTGQSLG